MSSSYQFQTGRQTAFRNRGFDRYLSCTGSSDFAWTINCASSQVWPGLDLKLGIRASSNPSHLCSRELFNQHFCGDILAQMWREVNWLTSMEVPHPSFLIESIRQSPWQMSLYILDTASTILFYPYVVLHHPLLTASQVGSFIDQEVLTRGALCKVIICCCVKIVFGMAKFAPWMWVTSSRYCKIAANWSTEDFILSQCACMQAKLWWHTAFSSSHWPQCWFHWHCPIQWDRSSLDPRLQVLAMYWPDGYCLHINHVIEHRLLAVITTRRNLV